MDSQCTVRFGSTAKVLATCKLKYYRISECVVQVGRMGWTLPAVLVARAFVGLGEGASMPAMNNLMATRVPPQQRASSIGTAFAGFHSGTLGACPPSSSSGASPACHAVKIAGLWPGTDLSDLQYWSAGVLLHRSARKQGWAGQGWAGGNLCWRATCFRADNSHCFMALAQIYLSIWGKVRHARSLRLQVPGILFATSTKRYGPMHMLPAGGLSQQCCAGLKCS